MLIKELHQLRRSAFTLSVYGFCGDRISFNQIFLIRSVQYSTIPRKRQKDYLLWAFFMAWFSANLKPARCVSFMNFSEQLVMHFDSPSVSCFEENPYMKQ